MAEGLSVELDSSVAEGLSVELILQWQRVCQWNLIRALGFIALRCYRVGRVSGSLIRPWVYRFEVL